MNYKNRTEVKIQDDLIIPMVTEHFRQVTKTQLNTVRDYDTLQKANGNTPRSRLNRTQFLLLFARELGKPFNKVTEKDVLRFLGKKLKPNTRNSYVEQIKHFFKWVGREDIVKNLKQKPVDDFIDSKELLSDKDIYDIIESATHPRDKCLVALLFDLAIERKTISALNIEDVEITGDRVYVTVQGKKRGNRQKRRMQCITSAPYVVDWLNLNPNKNTPLAPLFISLSPNSYGQRVSYNFAYDTLKLLAKRAGIQKKVWCHLVRHSKLTDLYRKGFRGVPLQRYAGWVNGNMEQRYVNLAPEEMDNMRVSAEQGIEYEITKPEPSKVISIVCPRCKHLNTSTAEYCSKCWMPLKREVVVKEQDELEMLRVFRDIVSKNPQIIQQMEDERTAKLQRENKVIQKATEEDQTAYENREAF